MMPKRTNSPSTTAIHIVRRIPSRVCVIRRHSSQAVSGRAKASCRRAVERKTGSKLLGLPRING